MSHKCWGKLDPAPKFSEPFSLGIKNFPSTYTLEKFTRSLVWSLTYYPALVGFHFSTEFCTVFFPISTSYGFCDQAKDHKHFTRMSSWTSGTAYIKLWHVFPSASIRGFGKVVKKFGSLLLKPRNPGFYLSHSFLLSSCAEMFNNLRMSTQAMITFHSETFGNLLIDIQPLAKKATLFLDSLK